jgi:hypothetical protein
MENNLPIDSQISNPKIPRVENSKKVFKSEVTNDGIPYYKKKKLKKLNDLDKYLIFAFTSILIFTIAVLVIYIFTRDEPAVLVGCFFTAFGGEILMCALIKRLKLHKEIEAKKQDNVPY